MSAPQYAVLELCKNRAGYEAIPEARMSLDLTDVERRLQLGGFEPLVNARVILVAKWGRVEVSVFESGKLLFKTREKDDAEAVMHALVKAMGW
ncbi:MAG: hypothetical protein ACYDCK_13295 [Thermoplasmatota archaeon]